MNSSKISASMMEEIVEPRVEQVADYYDKFDPVYRSIWGENLHHGLWECDVMTAGQASDRLTRLVGERLALQAGDRLLDVGCGYGRMAADMAKEFQLEATGMTISSKQWDQRVPGVDVQHGDWLENAMPAAAFDSVMAVESLEHMSDPQRAVEEMARVLKPGGRMVCCCWLVSDSLQGWENVLLIEPIRRDGCLNGMHHEQAIRRWIEGADLELDRIDDLSDGVGRSWSDASWRASRSMIFEPELRRLMLSNFPQCARLAITFQRIRIAYVIGALRYVVFSARRPI